MEPILIPQPDTIPVSWGWLQLLLLVTFPLHLLAMNAMVGGLAIGLFQQLRGGSLQKRLAQRIAVILPMVIALTVNLGVAPLLFVQVLYGQFLYTSSILMGVFWLLLVPILMVAYYGAYLYDFRFKKLGGAGPWLAVLVLLLLMVVGLLLSCNMQLMIRPELFAGYFADPGGTSLPLHYPTFLPRFLHMMLGALAIGGLFVALLGRYGGETERKLAGHAEQIGLSTFLIVTMANVMVGFWFFITLPERLSHLFLGGDLGATVAFVSALVLVFSALVAAYAKRFWLTLGLATLVVTVMTFLRSWLRSGYLRDDFTLDTLVVVPQYSPLIFFLATLVVGLLALGWLGKKTAETLRQEREAIRQGRQTKGRRGEVSGPGGRLR